MSLAAKVRTARESKGLSIDALARATGLTHKGIENIEAGLVAKPHVHTIAALSNVLGPLHQDGAIVQLVTALKEEVANLPPEEPDLRDERDRLRWEVDMLREVSEARRDAAEAWSKVAEMATSLTVLLNSGGWRKK